VNGGDRQRREGRGLWWAWTLLLVAVVAAGGFVATRTGLLDVDRVKVIGPAGRRSAEQLRAAGIPVGPINTVRQAFLEATDLGLDPVAVVGNGADAFRSVRSPSSMSAPHRRCTARRSSTMSTSRRFAPNWTTDPIA
jgi:hypothetical protein